MAALDIEDVRPRARRAADPLLECLTVAAKAHGSPVSAAALLDSVQSVSPISEDAAALALDRIQFKAAWTKCDPRFLRQVYCPLVVSTGDGGYIVVLRVTNQRLEVFEGGTRKIVHLDMDEFKELAPRRFLLMSPPPLRNTQDDLLGLDRGSDWFWKCLWRFKRSFLEAAFLSAIVNVLAIALTILTMSVYDRVLPNQAYVTLWALAIGAGIAVMFEFTMRMWRGWLLDHVGKKLDLLLGSLVFRHVMATRLEVRAGSSSGEQASTIREYESLRDFMTSLTLAVVADLPFGVVFLFVIAYIAGALAWVPAIGMLVVIVVTLVVQVPLARLMQESLRQTGARAGLVIEALNAMDMLKSLRAEMLVVRQHDRLAAENSRISMKTRLLSSLTSGLAGTVQQICTIAILVWGVHRAGDNLATSGAIVAAVMLMGRAMQPVLGLSMIAMRFQQARTSLRALNIVMRRPLEREAGLSYFHRTSWEGHVRVSRLSFSYSEQLPPVLRDINLNILPGERVGIVGRVGSGKSTLLRLLAGLYRPGDGEVVLDGLDLRHVDVSDVRRSLRMLTQDVRLMQGTLLDNLRIAAPHASDDTILSVARMTGVADFAMRHPMGLNLPVGEGGRMLSGGQRQAVALAQVALSDANVLLLDEPTASMDRVSEQAILAAITKVAQGRTLILVTHNEALLTLVDRLVVIHEGSIALDGPRDQVLRQLQVAARPASTPGVPATVARAA